MIDRHVPPFVVGIPELHHLSEAFVLREIYRMTTVILANQEISMTEMETLQADVDALTGQVASNTAVIDALRGTLGGGGPVQAQLDAALAQVATMTAADVAGAAELQTNLQGLDDKVKAANSALATADTTPPPSA